MEDTLRANTLNLKVTLISLNPCFNGRYSQSYSEFLKAADAAVLILVLMEDTLREKHGLANPSIKVVLILVLMEDTLREDQAVIRNEGPFVVLILVLMEDTLRAGNMSTSMVLRTVLILVLMEDTLRVSA